MKLPVVTARNYFSPEMEQAYMGCTQLKAFLSCEAAALARVRGEWQEPVSTALLAGSYVDAHFSGSLPVFKAQHPEIFRRDGALRADFSAADTIIAKMEDDRLYSLLMSGKKQVIRIGEIAGVPFKIRMDSLLDESAGEAIQREFPDTAVIQNLCSGAIVDQKVMRDLKDVWSDEEGQRIPFWQAWGYDIQGAIYTAVEGRSLPFILAVGTKEDPPDLAAIHIRDEILLHKLYEVEDALPRIQAVKEGTKPPVRCEHCAYCRATRTLKTIVDYGE